MKNNELKEIARSLVPGCYNIESRIAKHTPKDAELWAKSDSKRHAHTIRAILRHANKCNRFELNVLNASGLGCGHQDISIITYFRTRTSIELKWTALESPNSEYLENECLKELITNMGISLLLKDYSREVDPFREMQTQFDVVLFTEIAEHLDHSVFLNALSAIRSVMKDNGVLIITTPNLLRLVNRLQFMIGKGDTGFFGDGTLNAQTGLYGHLVNYDISRIGRLLKDTGYDIDISYTFSFGEGPTKYPLMRRTMDILSIPLRNAMPTIFIVARKAEPVKTAKSPSG